jgi:hypothetical protein
VVPKHLAFCRLNHVGPCTDPYAPHPSEAISKNDVDLLGADKIGLIPAGSQADPKACLRYDGGKEPLHLIPIRPLFELARVYGYGSKKYDDDNWRKATTWRRVIASMLRHVYRFAAGEDIDPESGVHHMAHAAFWAFALIDWSRTPQGRACDDRLKYEQETLLTPSQDTEAR